jgi:hypothetical protein
MINLALGGDAGIAPLKGLRSTLRSQCNFYASLGQETSGEGALWERQAGHYKGLEKICTAAGRYTNMTRGQVGISPGDLPTLGKSPPTIEYTIVHVRRFRLYSLLVSYYKYS